MSIKYNYSLAQQSGQRAMRAQVSADLEERKWIAPHHIGATLTYRSTPQGQYIHTLTCYSVICKTND